MVGEGVHPQVFRENARKQLNRKRLWEYTLLGNPEVLWNVGHKARAVLQRGAKSGLGRVSVGYPTPGVLQKECGSA
jgi:hypothetical protein